MCICEGPGETRRILTVTDEGDFQTEKTTVTKEARTVKIYTRQAFAKASYR